MTRLTKEELRAPDQIWQASRGLMTWLGNRWVALGVFALVAFGLGLVLLVWQQASRATEGKAQFQLSKVDALVEQWKLQKGEERAKSRTKIDEELATLDSQFKSSRANKMAGFVRGELAATDGDWKKAASYYQSAVSFFGSSDKSFGSFPYAVALEQSGDSQNALEQFKKISTDDKSPFQELAYLGQARVLKNLSKPSEALATYEKFLEKFPRSAELGFVRSQMAGLKATP